MTTMETHSEHASFGGKTGFYSHRSEACGGGMRFAVYTPPQAAERPVPVLYYLAGLTCRKRPSCSRAEPSATPQNTA